MEEEAAPPVAREWGRAQRKEKGVGKGGTVHLGLDVPPSKPSASFLGRGKAKVAIILIPSLWSPPCTWCFVVGQTIIWEVYLHWQMHCNPYFNHGRSVGFPSVTYISRGALTQNVKCCGRVCEASGNFTCRFKSKRLSVVYKWSSRQGFNKKVICISFDIMHLKS